MPWIIPLIGVLLGVAASAPPPPAPRGEVTLPSGKILFVEVADTPESRARGYMFRERIGDDEGMVFLMDGPDFHSFWMKNCRVNLDIIWLDEGWRVSHIEHSLPPCRVDPCPHYFPMRISQYVLEVRGGLTREQKIRLGDTIRFVPLQAASAP